MDYKATLNLPQTEFPMKANLTQREKEILTHWEDIHLYEKICKKGKSLSKFILHDGPPYANGHIHMGHALNKILTLGMGFEDVLYEIVAMLILSVIYFAAGVWLFKRTHMRAA